jgi:hypothetical protein
VFVAVKTGITALLNGSVTYAKKPDAQAFPANPNNAVKRVPAPRAARPILPKP